MDSTAPVAEKPNWHLGHLDALRGLAVLGVVLVHAALDSSVPARWTRFAYLGQRGVQLFFLVSAFTLFLSNDQRRQAEFHPTRNFFLRRLFRLTPMYYTAIALSAALHPEVIGGWRDLLLGLVYLQWISPMAILHVAPGAWTLSIEAMFYLCLPLFFRWVTSLRRAVTLLLLAAPLCAGGSALLAQHHRELYQYFSFLWFPIELPIFLMGIVIYFAWKRRISTAHLHPSAARLTPASRHGSARLAALFYLAAFALLALSFPETNRKLYLSSAACALLLLAVLLRPWPLLVNRVTIYLGKVSYSIYLLHGFILLPLLAAAGRVTWFQQHAALRFAIVLLLTTGLTAAGAGLTWLYIEQTGIRLGRRLIRHLEHRAERRQATALPAPASALASDRNSADAQF